jgi:hypothetical protein
MISRARARACTYKERLGRLLRQEAQEAEEDAGEDEGGAEINAVSE